MLILFDNGTPAPLRHALTNHVVVEAIERGWDRLLNGELIAAAEAAGFEVLLTTDKNMRYQQNLTGRKIAIEFKNQAKVVRIPFLSHCLNRWCVKWSRKIDAMPRMTNSANAKAIGSSIITSRVGVTNGGPHECS